MINTATQPEPFCLVSARFSAAKPDTPVEPVPTTPDEPAPTKPDDPDTPEEEEAPEGEPEFTPRRDPNEPEEEDPSKETEGVPCIQPGDDDGFEVCGVPDYSSLDLASVSIFGVTL